MITVRKNCYLVWIYTSVWILVAAMYLFNVMRARTYTSQPVLDLVAVGRMVRALLPFLVAFLVHDNVLIPRLLFRGRLKLYLLSTLLLVGCVWMWQNVQFTHDMARMPEPGGPAPQFPRPLLPLPLVLDLVYDTLIVGANLAIALMFQHFSDRLEREKLLKANAESNLLYLRAQINPHFYLNMLNNLHGMIEIDPAQAQEMVIDMSGLMRYMLYDTSVKDIALSAEVAFIRNYLNVMRRRYPEDKVDIITDFPTEADMSGVKVPPQIFVVFIENSFKHGISYRHRSFVDIRIAVADGAVVFNCRNSKHGATADETHGARSRIGLRNVSERLRLLYGEGFLLRIDGTETEYIVDLRLPLYATANPDN
ncbi:MAG: histidine kinase [Bacteroidales bacterium]|nr:histidine kinase [Bacteroidales bacterium]